MRDIVKITIADKNEDIITFFIKKGNNQRFDVENYGSFFIGFGTKDEVDKILGEKI